MRDQGPILIAALASLSLFFGVLSPVSAEQFTFSTEPSTIDYSSLSGIGLGDVRVRLRENPPPTGPLSFLDGFSFSLSNDPLVFNCTSLVPSGIMLFLNGGNGPQLATVDIAEDGVTARWIFAVSGGMDVLFPSDIEIARLTVKTISETWAENEVGGLASFSDQSPASLDLVADVAVVSGEPIEANWEIEPIVFQPGPRGFLRGDTNSDGVVEGIPDAVMVLSGLFDPDVQLNCLEAADLNDDGMVDLADPIFLLNWKFGGGPGPSGPYPNCGLDPTPDSLDCAQPAC